MTDPEFPDVFSFDIPEGVEDLHEPATICRHKRLVGDCDECEREADLEFDAWRESR